MAAAKSLSLLVLRHEPFEHMGHFETILESHNIPFYYHDLGDPLPAGEFPGLIIMGGPMSANDSLPGIVEELDLIRTELNSATPMLGICLGAQMIAKALGARVYRNPEKEIGWAPVYWTEAAQTDPLFRGLESPSEFLHWHGETFDLPAGSVWLAYSDKCRHQAYRYGSNVWGLQFHPEVTPAMIADWSAQPVNCGDVADLATPVDPAKTDLKPMARIILERWLEAARLRSQSV